MADRKSVLPPAPHPASQSAAPNVVVEQAANFALSAIDSVLALLAVIVIAAGALFLSIAWTAGPQVWMQAAEYRKFTEHTDAAVVESWVSLTLDQSRIRSPSYWRASAKASRCALVEYGASWGSPMRRGFCGPQIAFNESYTLADLRDLAPHVPFAWARDERGFAVAEIRLDAPTRQWLASHPANTFMHARWPAKTELEWLRVELDRPVDLAIAGWSSGVATLEVAFDPNDPAGALPAGTIASRLSRPFNWIAVIVGAVAGLALWFKGMSLLPWLRDVAPIGRYMVAALPLFGLPWFADQFPDALRAMNATLAEVATDMFADVDKVGGMVSWDPALDARHDDARLVWRAGEGLYADTFGRLQFSPPRSPFASSDAALAALVESVDAQVAAMDDASRVTLFASLRRDKTNDLKGAGVVFMTAAKAAIVDARASTQVRRAAKDFLAEWLLQPVEAFDTRSLGYNERKRLYSDVENVR